MTWPPSIPAFLFPCTKKPPEWVKKVVTVFEKAREGIDTRSAPHQTNDEVLELRRPDLEAIGFKVESGKRLSTSCIGMSDRIGSAGVSHDKLVAVAARLSYESQETLE